MPLDLCAPLLAAALTGAAAPALAGEKTNWPNYRESDFTITDYKFASGETLPRLKLHYRTLGSAQRNAAGEIINGVLLLQGNTGTGANWLRPSLADELFKVGQPLPDAGVARAIEDGREKLGKNGRLVVRASGTEPVVRVMGEGDKLDRAPVPGPAGPPDRRGAAGHPDSG